MSVRKQKHLNKETLLKMLPIHFLNELSNYIYGDRSRNKGELAAEAILHSINYKNYIPMTAIRDSRILRVLEEFDSDTDELYRKWRLEIEDLDNSSPLHRHVFPSTHAATAAVSYFIEAGEALKRKEAAEGKVREMLKDEVHLVTMAILRRSKILQALDLCPHLEAASKVDDLLEKWREILRFRGDEDSLIHERKRIKDTTEYFSKCGEQIKSSLEGAIATVNEMTRSSKPVSLSILRNSGVLTALGQYQYYDISGVVELMEKWGATLTRRGDDTSSLREGFNKTLQFFESMAGQIAISSMQAEEVIKLKLLPYKGMLTTEILNQSKIVERLSKYGGQPLEGRADLIAKWKLALESKGESTAFLPESSLDVPAGETDAVVKKLRALDAHSSKYRELVAGVFLEAQSDYEKDKSSGKKGGDQGKVLQRGGSTWREEEKNFINLLVKKYSFEEVLANDFLSQYVELKFKVQLLTDDGITNVFRTFKRWLVRHNIGPVSPSALPSHTHMIETGATIFRVKLESSVEILHGRVEGRAVIVKKVKTLELDEDYHRVNKMVYNLMEIKREIQGPDTLVAYEPYDMTLHQYILNFKKSAVTSYQLLNSIAKDLCAAVEERIKKYPVLNRLLDTKTVFLVKNRVKLCDLGPSPGRSPSVSSITSSQDLKSLSVCLIALFCNGDESERNMYIVDSDSAWIHPLHMPECLSHLLFGLVSGMRGSNSYAKLTIDEVVNHPFLWLSSQRIKLIAAMHALLYSRVQGTGFPFLPSCTDETVMMLQGALTNYIEICQAQRKQLGCRKRKRSPDHSTHSAAAPPQSPGEILQDLFDEVRRVHVLIKGKMRENMEKDKGKEAGMEGGKGPEAEGVPSVIVVEPPCRDCGVDGHGVGDCPEAIALQAECDIMEQYPKIYLLIVACFSSNKLSPSLLEVISHFDKL